MVPVRARLPLVVAASLALTAGCGRRQEASHARPLTLEELDRRRDTTGLSEGTAIVRRFEPYRMENGAMRVRGELRLPVGTVLQITVFRPGERWPFARVQSEVRDGGHFDTAPIIAGRGPAPAGRYHFALTVYFDAASQPPEVLRATDDGRRLRGPGVTRDLQGGAAFSYAEDLRL
jgi:hypothetical protein